MNNMPHPSPLTMLNVALIGSPNCGKTALFNALTGSHQRVANYPGITVEKKEGHLKNADGQLIRILDLPGTYSLDPQSLDEEVTLKILLNQDQTEKSPDVIIAVADATMLERNLSLLLELKELKRPMVIALNMMDLARQRGLKLDINKLSHILEIPVVPVVAPKKEGISDLLEVVSDLSNPSSTQAAPAQWTKPTKDQIKIRFDKVDQILKDVIQTPKGPDLLTERVDRLVLNPITGSVILALILLVMFQAVFTWAEPAMDLIEGLVGSFGTFVQNILPDGFIKNLIVEGAIAGVGSVLVFLPQIAILFAFILFLEDFGYMARAAFIMDKTMGKVGLHGRAFIPLLSSFACAIPGIMATRTIRSPKDRIATILIAPLMTCSARLPVYTLLIAAFIPNREVFGPLKLQGLVMFALYFGGIIFGLLVALILKKTALKGPTPPLVLEMPTYKIPSLRSILFGVWERISMFLRRAGKTILGVSVGLWFLASFPAPPQNADLPAIHYSLAGRIGHALEPAFAPVGFDWRIVTGIIPGFAAREVMVGALGTVFAIEAADDEALEKSLSEKLSSTWGLPTGLALLVWYIFSPQCLATFAVMRRETNSYKWPIIGFSYMLLLAYVMAMITFQVASALS